MRGTRRMAHALRPLPRSLRPCAGGHQAGRPPASARAQRHCPEPHSAVPGKAIARSSVAVIPAENVARVHRSSLIATPGRR
jgi:hypothetical protein